MSDNIFYQTFWPKNESLEKLQDLRDFRGMKKPSHVLEYPVVMKQVLEYISLSSPDLSIWETLPLPVMDKIKKRYVTSSDIVRKGVVEVPKGSDYAALLGNRMLAMYVKITKHMEEKKWVPDASDVKATVIRNTGPMTLPAFAKIIKKGYDISEDTIRRDVDKGVIKCSRTTGKHRRIPSSEVGRYSAYLDGKIASTGKQSLIRAMRLVEGALKQSANKKQE